MSRLRRFRPTPLGWAMLTLLVVFGAVAVIADSGPLAALAALGFLFVLGFAAGPSPSIQRYGADSADRLAAHPHAAHREPGDLS